MMITLHRNSDGFPVSISILHITAVMENSSKRRTVTQVYIVGSEEPFEVSEPQEEVEAMIDKSIVAYLSLLRGDDWRITKETADDSGNDAGTEEANSTDT